MPGHSEKQMTLSDEIAGLALVVAAASFCFSLQSERKNRQLLMLKRKHDVIAINTSCKNKLDICRSHIIMLGMFLTESERQVLRPGAAKNLILISEIKDEIDETVATLTEWEIKDRRYGHDEVMFLENIARRCEHVEQRIDDLVRGNAWSVEVAKSISEIRNNRLT